MMTLDDLLVELATLVLALHCPDLWCEVEQTCRHHPAERLNHKTPGVVSTGAAHHPHSYGELNVNPHKGLRHALGIHALAKGVPLNGELLISLPYLLPALGLSLSHRIATNFHLLWSQSLKVQDFG